jgi:lipoyl-dependent peroxiredoxin
VTDPGDADPRRITLDGLVRADRRRARPEGPAMPTRTATTTWNGDLQNGAGSVALTSSGLSGFEVSFPRRAADDAEGVTSPEELIAAAHSSCYAMQFSSLLSRAGGTEVALNVAADVTLGPDPAGGFKISGITLRVSGSAAGVDGETFAKLADEAKAGCPVSKALAATDITLSLT